jgi:ABC-type multidrug transport system fused ATPase/permease subunit
VIYLVIFLVEGYTIPLEQAQTLSCLFPPLALQLASASFLKSHQGLPLSGICGMLVLDIFLFSTLAWYFNQVWPSKLGIPKPFYFPLMPSYWFRTTSSTLNPRKVSDTASQDVELFTAEVTDGEVAVETANEKILGLPSVIVKNLRKTFGGSFKAVNGLNFKMYENQIFALLGHNGAGKVSSRLNTVCLMSMALISLFLSLSLLLSLSIYLSIYLSIDLCFHRQRQSV